MELLQFNVKMRFLHGDLEEEVLLSDSMSLRYQQGMQIHMLVYT
jgi:hypothetical protein